MSVNWSRRKSTSNWLASFMMSAFLLPDRLWGNSVMLGRGRAAMQVLEVEEIRGLSGAAEGNDRGRELQNLHEMRRIHAEKRYERL
jgi:hypothetical protein